MQHWFYWSQEINVLQQTQKDRVVSHGPDRVWVNQIFGESRHLWRQEDGTSQDVTESRKVGEALRRQRIDIQSLCQTAVIRWHYHATVHRVEDFGLGCSLYLPYYSGKPRTADPAWWNDRLRCSCVRYLIIHVIQSKQLQYIRRNDVRVWKLENRIASALPLHMQYRQTFHSVRRSPKPVYN